MSAKRTTGRHRQFRSQAVKRKQILETAAQDAPVRSDMDPTERGRHAPWLWEVGKT